jgi:Zn-dependent membrane protease YugP
VLIPKGLRRFGADSAQALSSYGMIQGMALPVLGFPAAILGTVSGLLVPEIAESHAKGQQARLAAIMERVLHLTLLFSLVTLPVELNASNRAVALLQSGNMMSADELDGVRKVLNAAALTYVASVVSSALQLLRLVLISRSRRD